MRTALEHWTGTAGDAYTARNPLAERDQLEQLDELWRQIIAATEEWQGSILEVGANIGRNLRALRRFHPAKLYAIEPNCTARATLDDAGILAAPAWPHALPNLWLQEQYDLVFTSGVLIHIPPEQLAESCRAIVQASRRWIVAIEYFSAEPRMIPYRGEDNRLWARDFGKFYLEACPELEPIAAGFAWKGLTGLDDLTWWVLRKHG